MNDELAKIIKSSFEKIKSKNYKAAIEILYPKLPQFPDNIEILTQIAQCYYLMGEKEQASEYYEKAFEINEHSTLVLDPLIQLKIEQENYNEAVKYANYYLSCEDTNYATQKYLETLQEIKNYDAIDNFSKTADENNLNSASLSIIATAILDNEKNIELSKEEQDEITQRAFSFAQKSLEKDKNNMQAICALMKCHIAKEEYDKIEELYKATPQGSNDAEFISLYGYSKYINQNFEAAIDCFSRAIELDNTNIVIYHNLAHAYANIGWLDEAETIIKKALALNEKNIDCRLTLANIYYMQDDFDKTLLTLSFVDELDPENVQMNLLYAYAYANQDNFEKAREYAQKLEGKIDSSYLDDRFAVIYYNLGRFEKAYESIDKAISQEPENISFLNDKADFLTFDKKYDEALEIYRKIIEINPNYVDAYAQTARIYIDKDQFENALEYAKKAVDMDCNNAEYQFDLAKIYACLEKYDAAIACATFAVSITPDDIEKYRFLGYTYLSKGNVQSALSYFKEVLSINPNDFKEIKYIAFALKAKGEYDLSLEYYQKAFRINPYDYDFIMEYSDFVKEHFSIFKGIKILLNFAKYSKNISHKKEAKNRAKLLIKENKSKLKLKEKLCLIFK